MPIQHENFDCDDKSKRKPLLIGCSGGGGHIAAIHGLHDFLAQKYPDNITLIKHRPVLYEEKQRSWARMQIAIGATATNHVIGLSPVLQTMLKFTHLPLLPDAGELRNEINTLNEKEKKGRSNRHKYRAYVDMLLDIYPAGYESAAIWNVLQRKDKTTDLKKLIELQSKNDEENYSHISQEILKLIDNAAACLAPYTEIISTQAMGLPALCDTAKEYNEANPDKSPLIIHQYLTDLPTKGAIHFFKALSTLNPEQQKQMKLYGVGMSQEILDYFFPEGHHFSGVYDIPADHNPMVRAGFKDANNDNSKKFNSEITISLNGEDPIDIAPQEQIASIMLGSQASHDTVEYIETLIENGMEKVFVFGGKTNAISAKIDAILAEHPTYTDKIIRLGNQDDIKITQLMTRSNMVIIRGGGLSVMEQMAMPHNKHQTVLIHHANSQAHELTSGISWEDDNVVALMANLKNKHVHAEKTSPDRAKKQIAEAQLIAAAKHEKRWTIDEISRYVCAIPPEKLQFYVESLKRPGMEKLALFAYFVSCEKNEIEAQKNLEINIESIIDSLATNCDGCLHYLETIITDEVSNLSDEAYDIEQIMDTADHPKYIHASPAFFSAIASYKAVVKLMAILNDNTITQPSEKLHNFKKEYDHPETRKALLYTNDSFIMRFIREINYQLSKIYIFSWLGLDKFFTPSQKVRRQMEDVKPELFNSIPSPENGA